MLLLQNNAIFVFINAIQLKDNMPSFVYHEPAFLAGRTLLCDDDIE